MSIKPVIRELREAVLNGMGHAHERLHLLTHNLEAHFDNVGVTVRDADDLDAVSRGWLRDRKLRKGEKTDPGWHFLPDADRAAAGDVPVYPGEYTLDLHGAPHAVQGGDGTMMDAATFAEHIRRRTDWDGQTPIRLFSCDTGSAPDGFAQQLSNHLQVDVTAPTKPVWSTRNGTPFVTDIDPITLKPVRPHNGSWVTFTPEE